MSGLAQIIESKEKDLGDGVIVRRALPTTKKRNVGPFVFWDHMGPVPMTEDLKINVRAHPHIGLATLTYLFDGELMHRDNLGNIQAIRAGEVNWMTAGRGIAHSERATYSDQFDKLEGIQLWVALPKESEEVDPDFQHLKSETLSTIQCGDCEMLLIAGEAMGKTSPVNVYSPLFYLNGQLDAGKSFSMPVNEGHEAAVYVPQGQIKIGEETLVKGQLAIFEVGAKVNFEVLEASNVMVFGGLPFPEPRLIWWNFVSSSKDRIEQAKLDWKESRFPPVVDETESIPLPPN